MPSAPGSSGCQPKGGSFVSIWLLCRLDGAQDLDISHCEGLPPSCFLPSCLRLLGLGAEPSLEAFPGFPGSVKTLSIYTQDLISSVQLLSRVRLSATPWTAARQASLSITNSRILLKLMPIESVIPSNHLILCHPLLLLPSIFPSIRVVSNEVAKVLEFQLQHQSFQ